MTPPSTASTPQPLLAYATPTPLAPAGDILRDGNLLVVRDKSTLPDRCLVCAGPAAAHPILLQFTWDASFRITHEPTLQLRQSGRIRAYLCARHRARWLRGRILGGAALALSSSAMLAGMVVGIISESSDIPTHTVQGLELVVTGFAAMILSLFYFTISTRTLTCRRIAAGYLYLEGAAPAFLQPLPPVPSSQRPPTP